MTAALARMSASLDVWEQLRKEAEAGCAPGPRRHRPTGRCYADAQQFNAAIAAIRGAVPADAAVAAGSASVSLHVYLGRLYKTVGQQAEAATAFQAARTIDPSDPVAAYCLAFTCPRLPLRTTLSTTATGRRRCNHWWRR